MDNPKHTPGPWRVVARHAAFGASRGITTVGSSTHGAVADCGGCSVSVAQDEANAHLIAAAPELLDALQLALNLEGLCEWAVYKQEQIGGPLAGLDVRAHFKPIRDAIRKATGGE